MKRCFSFLLSGAGRVLVTSLALRILIAGRLELAPDEAYYWVWSRALAAGYFDHPPGIAFLIAAGTRLFGDSTLAVRCGAIFLSTVTSLLVYSAALMVHNDGRVARRALITLLVLPVFVVGGVLVTPDVPLAFGWALTLWGMVRLETGHTSHVRGVWAVIGLGVGIACLSKLTGLLLLFLVVAWCLGVRRSSGPVLGRLSGDRRASGPILAISIVVAMSIPNLLWNLDHDFISYSFQLSHGLRGGSSGGILGLLAFLGGQAGIVGPLVFWFCLVFWFSRRSGVDRTRPSQHSRSQNLNGLLWWLSAPVFVVFALASLRTRGEANWPAPVYLAALVALPWSAWSRRWCVAVQASAAVITMLMLLQATSGALPLSGRADPTAQFYGWKALGGAVKEALLEKPALVVTDRYQEASELSYYLPLQVEVVALPNRGRGDQFDIWDPPQVDEGADVLWVNRAGAGSGPPFGGFEEVLPPTLVTVGRKGQTRQYHLYRLKHAQATQGIDGARVAAGPRD